jgi:hypothetical protein
LHISHLIEFEWTLTPPGASYPRFHLAFQSLIFPKREHSTVSFACPEVALRMVDFNFTVIDRSASSTSGERGTVTNPVDGDNVPVRH